MRMRFAATAFLLFLGLSLECESHMYQEQSEDYLNVWAVKVDSHLHDVDSLAQKYGFRNMGAVKNLKNVYKFVHLERPKRSATAEEELTSHLMSDSMVVLAEQQVWREIVPYGGYLPPTDPSWPQQWNLLNTGLNGSISPGYDVNVEPAWIQGYTGCNSVVGIVDTGIDFDHPDLINNTVVELGFDYVDNDPDPNPTPWFDTHGTSVAGIVAMDKGNGHCGTGVAYGSSIAAIRLLGFWGTTDMVIAMSLSHESDRIRIYSNSWGPPDTGSWIGGPGALVQDVLMNAAQSGKGTIFVFAAGNGGDDDNCVANGYATSIYVIAIGAASSNGTQAWFDEECSCKMATAFVTSSIGVDTTSTSPDGLCVDDFSGTSAAAPIASGIIALALEANPTLSWRDVQYLIAYTSNPDLLHDGDWATNGAGLSVSHKHGFGVMDAEAMVTRARHWINVPDQQSIIIAPPVPSISARFSEPTELHFSYAGTDIQALEHVVVSATLSTNAERGSMTLELLSPSGTRSQLLTMRPRDVYPGEFSNWPFMSVHFWGEDPTGDWLLTLRHQKDDTGSANMTNVTVIMYGVSTIPEAVSRIPSECASVCKRGCAAAGPEFCDACKNLRDAKTLECIDECPTGYSLRNGYCYDETLPEKECIRNLSVPEGSCRNAGYTGCCTDGECAGSPQICFCDQGCYSRSDCCPDIAAVCKKAAICFSAYFISCDGICVYGQRCDGHRDCRNGEDEINCTPPECQPGYQLSPDNRSCIDVNECETNNGGCSQICTNTEGSFNCSCSEGYQLALDSNTTCTDVNECLTGNGGCEHFCINTEGSFQCSCSPGYVLSIDSVSCTDVNECETNNGGCSQICSNTQGSFDCSCRQGYQLVSGSKTACTDVNECSIGNGGCEHTCINSAGSFSCSCSSGFVLTGDGKSCEPDCGGTLTANSGSFQTPNWPQTYPVNIECEWIIDLPTSGRKAIRFTFDPRRYGLADNPPTPCVRDWVEFFDGIGEGASSLGRFCHKILPPTVTTTSSEARVLFVAGPIHGPRRRGFRVTYETVQ